MNTIRKKKKAILLGIIILIVVLIMIFCIKNINKKNNNNLSGNQDAIYYSVQSGAYTDDFDLKLSTDSDRDIYYTLDGSDPVVNGILYEDAITIGEVTGDKEKTENAPLAVSVAAVTKDKRTDLYGTEYISTYYIGDEYQKYHLPVFSIQVVDSDFFTANGIYQTVMNNITASKQKINAYIEFFDSNGVRQNNEYVQLSMHGTGSLAFDMKSMRLYFNKKMQEMDEDNSAEFNYDLYKGTAVTNEGEIITSFQRIILRNGGNDCSGSMLRDLLASRICRNLNIDNMAGQPVLVYINSEFWGLYNARERYDAKYFTEHYGVAEEDVVLLETPSPLETGCSNASYILDEGMDGDEQDFNDLVDYCSSQDLSINDHYQYICDHLDIDSLIDLYCANLFLANMDWPSNNVRVWRNKNSNNPNGIDTKWHFLLDDLDCSMALDSEINVNLNCDLYGDTILGQMMRALLTNARFYNQFIDRFEELLEEDFSVDRTLAELNSLELEIKDAVNLNIEKWGTPASYSDWQDQIDMIREFLTERKEYEITYLAELQDNYETFILSIQ